MKREAFESEIGKIEQIVQINGLTINIRRLIRRRKLRKLLSSTESNPTPTTGRKRERWIRFPYLGIPSEKVATELEKYGYKTGFYPVTAVRDLISLKDSIPVTEKSGVYEISCGECPSIYVGQTGRKLKTRIAEHRVKININLTNDNNTDSDLSSISAVALHCASTGHDLSLIHISEPTRPY